VDVGLITTPHGIRGEVKVRSMTFDPEERFTGRGNRCFSATRGLGSCLHTTHEDNVYSMHAMQAVHGICSLQTNETVHTSMHACHVFPRVHLPVGHTPPRCIALLLLRLLRLRPAASLSSNLPGACRLYLMPSTSLGARSGAQNVILRQVSHHRCLVPCYAHRSVQCAEAFQLGHLVWAAWCLESAPTWCQPQ
jgi:hypothetical protein